MYCKAGCSSSAGSLISKGELATKGTKGIFLCLLSLILPQNPSPYAEGRAHLYSYEWEQAVRAFNEALKLNPNQPLAYIGLSYAYVELNDPAAAHSALDRAIPANEQERSHVEVRKAQMAAEDAPHDAAKLAAYRKTLDEALKAFPSDEDLWLQRGIAESPDPADRGQGSGTTSIPFYRQALKLAPNDFAPHHLLAHAFENTGKIDEALKHATEYARLAPNTPHALHMRGHELRRTGRIDEAIAEFEKANVPAEHDWHYHHNLDLLASSYQYRGEMAKAEEIFKRSFAIPSHLAVQEFNKREWPEFLLSRKRPEEARAAAERMIEHVSPLIRATGYIESGRSMLAEGRFKEAADAANAALRELKGASDGQALVVTAFQELQGEFFLRTGQGQKGRSMLDGVIQKLRAAPGPDEWSQALFTLEAIAEAAREAGDWEYAARVAGEMLFHDPYYAGTHYALAVSAEHAADMKTARAESELAKKYWSKADANFPELRVADRLTAK
jgi:tetratricopeptide (TPR) repeat protein